MATCRSGKEIRDRAADSFPGVGSLTCRARKEFRDRAAENFPDAPGRPRLAVGVLSSRTGAGARESDAQERPRWAKGTAEFVDVRRSTYRA